MSDQQLDASLSTPQQRRSAELTRRELLKAGALVAGAGLASSVLPAAAQRALAQSASTAASIDDIEHVIIFIQENRSFDHYFGSYKGVRGFADPNVRRYPNGLPVFYQPDPQNSTDPPKKYLLPFHFDTINTYSASTHDITHDWAPQHLSWNHGVMNGFVTARQNPTFENDAYGFLTMGYYTRADLPYYYALADAFTICDAYHSSVIGPTDPNRLYSMSAWIDPHGVAGGPLVETLTSNRQSYFGKFTWTTMPEQLQARGISWKVYQSSDAEQENNVLAYFAQYQNPTGALYQNGLVPSYPANFLADVASGNLPQVSWILAPLTDSEHPPAPSALGENDMNTILTALWANPALWAKTALFFTYDENGGFFDHVVPPTAPKGTPGEYLTAPPVNGTNLDGFQGPIGLGFRVPMLVISPFARGGFVSSDVFDHTSTLRFLETRFGVEVPNLSKWRRAHTGDLTSAFNFAAPDYSIPTLPPVAPLVALATKEFIASGGGAIPPPVPNPQSLPTQEPGTPKRPSGPV